MEDTSEREKDKNSQKHINIGLLAHVDAGKTTLSEALLFKCGAISEPGRVDHRNAFLDTSPFERERGITIFSKQAELRWNKLSITLLDTPGHVDFSAEMERTLQVLDYAVLVISGTDGVQGHTETLWKLLERYEIPVFIFVNKMDLPGTDAERLMDDIKSRLSDLCVDFSDTRSEAFLEEAAVCEEALLEKYLESGTLEMPDDLIAPVAARHMYPCFFGSALRVDGVEALLNGLEKFTSAVENGSEFGAKVFKITRDAQGTRLTHMKIIGGELRVRSIVQKSTVKKEGASTGASTGESAEEKVNQIRIYSGEKYETPDVVRAGQICAVTGLKHTYPGEGLGTCRDFSGEQLEPVLHYAVLFPDGNDPVTALKQFRELEEEDPKLHVVWDEKARGIFIQPMGEVQLDVLKDVVRERFGMEIAFGEGRIRYKETIRDSVEGVGHFEPLRHYAEVHLWMEPLPPGSGLVFDAVCSEDKLDLNWQRLVLTHLAEKEFVGVLTGSPITDMKITLAAGRAHLKHTEGGDFRQATYRAVRHGLMQAESVLLEPFYNFRIEVPPEMIGRVMADVKRMYGDFESQPEQDGSAVLTGRCPVAEMKEYPVEVASYTKGRGRIFCTPGGYAPCHNAEEVIAGIGYDCEGDVENTADSVFCSHGSGVVVKWDEVVDHMHVESIRKQGRFSRQDDAEERDAGGKANRSGTGEANWDGTGKANRDDGGTVNQGDGRKSNRKGGEKIRSKDFSAEDKELQAIFERTFGPVRQRAVQPEKRAIRAEEERVSEKYDSRHDQIHTGRTQKHRSSGPVEEYVLVDGYNIIFAWEDLNELSKQVGLDAARMRLMDMMCNFQGFTGCRLILVFDAYKVKGNPGSIETYRGISVVYTKEAETADMFIEKTTKKIAKKHRVRVATSDALEQMIILGHGATRLSADAFRKEVEWINERIREEMEKWKAEESR